MNGGTQKPATIQPVKAPTSAQAAMPTRDAADQGTGAGALGPAHALDQEGRNDCGECDEAADREVDPGGDDHHRHADGEDRDDGDLAGDVAQVIGAQESRSGMLGRGEQFRGGLPSPRMG